MILVADEGVDRAVVDRLRRDGHSVTWMAELSPSLPDDGVLEEANARGAVLLTADKDFGEMVFRQGRVHAGVVLLRLAGLTSSTKADVVGAACLDRASALVGAFSVVSPSQVRIRRRS